MSVTSVFSVSSVYVSQVTPGYIRLRQFMLEGQDVELDNYMLGMWFHAIQLSTTFIPSRKFVYLLQYSAVDTQTHSFTACCRAILPEVDTLFDFFFGR